MTMSTIIAERTDTRKPKTGKEETIREDEWSREITLHCTKNKDNSLNCKLNVNEEEKESEAESFAYTIGNADTLYALSSKHKKSEDNTKTDPMTAISLAMTVAILSGLTFSIGYLIVYLLYDYSTSDTFTFNYKMLISIALMLGLCILISTIAYMLIKKASH